MGSSVHWSMYGPAVEVWDKNKMDLSAQKEDFSCAYIRAVAATAGFPVDEPKRDNESVDLVVRGTDFDGAVRNPRAEVQVKCSANFNQSGETIKFPIKIKNYDDLRPVNIVVPRFLVVVAVPESANEWLEQTTEQMILRHCGYFVSLRGLPPTKKHNHCYGRCSC